MMNGLLNTYWRNLLGRIKSRFKCLQRLSDDVNRRLTMLEIRSQSEEMYIDAKSRTKFTCKLFSTYQRFQTAYLLPGLAQLLKDFV